MIKKENWKNKTKRYFKNKNNCNLLKIKKKLQKKELNESMNSAII